MSIPQASFNYEEANRKKEKIETLGIDLGIIKLKLMTPTTSR